MAEVTELIPADVKRTILIRQIAFLIGIAASVAIGVYVVLWAQTPNYSLLYGSLSQQDASEVISSLQSAGIEYRVDEGSGAIMVPTSKLHDARLKLAGEGLPKNNHQGFTMLQEEQGFGTSQFIEQARYQHALEVELSRTIEQVSAVRKARVHLAIPKQSPFVRDKKPSRASVLVDVYSGHSLQTEQVTAIANLVASSVPNLDFKHVSIVDQHGRLMTQNGASDDMLMSNSQFQYTRNVEQSFVKRIEDILTPIVGMNGVKAQVTAELDFTRTEQTRESYNPDQAVVRSEQIEEEMQQGNVDAGGVAGALSNQPPLNATAEEENAEPFNNGLNATEQVAEASSHRRSTRNFELDKTISHTKMASGNVRRLSVAVLLDYKRSFDETGAVQRIEHSPEELEQITRLVHEAIGYSPERGDRVSVMNAAFNTPGPIEEIPGVPIWKQAWIWDITKQVLGVAVVLFLVFGVLKPSMKNLVTKEISLHQAALSSPNLSMHMETNALEDNSQQPQGLPAPSSNANTPQLSAPVTQTYDDSLAAVRDIVKTDPKLAAQVVKNWVGDD